MTVYDHGVQNLSKKKLAAALPAAIVSSLLADLCPISEREIWRHDMPLFRYKT